MLKKFFQQLNVAVLCGLSCFIFFVLGFIWWIFDPTTPVPMWVVSLIVIVCYLICVVVSPPGQGEILTILSDLV